MKILNLVSKLLAWTEYAPYVLFWVYCAAVGISIGTGGLDRLSPVDLAIGIAGILLGVRYFIKSVTYADSEDA